MSSYENDSDMESDSSSYNYTIESDLEVASKKSDYKSAMKHIETYQLMYYIEHMKELARYFGSIFLRDVVEYTMDQFTRPRIDDEILKTKTIVLAGPTGYGKTCYAMAHFKHPAVIMSRADYKKINEDTDGLVFENLEMCNWSVDKVKNITDLSTSSYQAFGEDDSVFLQARLPRFICVNGVKSFWPASLFDFDGYIDETSQHHCNSIARRIHIEEIGGPLFKAQI